MASNCSFRITRTTEDLAQTITALSQRLIKLEQRFEALELQYKQNQSEIPLQQIEMLDGIDQQLKECKALLDSEVDLEESKEEEILNIDNQEEEYEEEEILNIDNQEEDSEQIWIGENKDESLAA